MILFNDVNTGEFHQSHAAVSRSSLVITTFPFGRSLMVAVSMHSRRFLSRLRSHYLVPRQVGNISWSSDPVPARRHQRRKTDDMNRRRQSQSGIALRPSVTGMAEADELDVWRS